MNTSLIINPRKVAKILLSIIAVLFVFHLMYVFTQLVYGYKLREFFKMFDFNSEGNLSTMYQVGALVITSFLLFFVGFIKKRENDKFAVYWLALGGIFFFMSFDEAAKMHERLNVVTRAMLPESSLDFLYFAWVIPYAILVLFVGIVYIRFLLNLPKRTAILFLVSGAIYVTGAIGFEMLTSYYRGPGFIIQLVITIEETMEKLGIVFFIYSILDYIKYNIGATINIRINDAEPVALKMKKPFVKVPQETES